jgi:hypothetical protein
MCRSYKKHLVLINNQYFPIKDWYRNNPRFFQHINRIPTSEQIGVVLINHGFNRFDFDPEVIYR